MFASKIHNSKIENFDMLLNLGGPLNWLVQKPQFSEIHFKK